MSNYSPPKGKEMAIAKKLETLIVKIAKQEIVYPWFGVTAVSINIGHAIEGVRMNGHQALTTIADLTEKFTELKDSMIDTIARANRTLELIEAAELIIENGIEPCEKCEGTKGKMEKASAGGISNYWSDCGNCHGRGCL